MEHITHPGTSTGVYDGTTAPNLTSLPARISLENSQLGLAFLQGPFYIDTSHFGHKSLGTVPVTAWLFGGFSLRTDSRFSFGFREWEGTPALVACTLRDAPTSSYCCSHGLDLLRCHAIAEQTVLRCKLATPDVLVASRGDTLGLDKYDKW